MRIYHHRQQTPFRYQTKSNDEVIQSAANQPTRAINGRAHWRSGVSNDRVTRADKVTSCRVKPDGVKSLASGAMDVEPPAIARAESSPSSSVSSTATTIDFDPKTETARKSAGPPTQQYRQWHHSYHPQHQDSHRHPGAPRSQERGMVPASPGPMTPRPTLGPRVVSQGEIGTPPKPYRVTLLPNRDSRSRFSWTPFAVDRRYSDQQLQQMHYQSQRFCSMHRSGYYGYPPSPYRRLPMPQKPYFLSGCGCAPEVIGHPALRIYKLSLPREYMKLLDQIVEGCEAFAQSRGTGWRTDLYSLTKQDIALMDAPRVMKLAMPIMHYLSHCICEIYHANGIKVDRNQPHVLKYNEAHTGVELHHDRCDVTANLMLSRSHTYVGGG